MGDAAESRTLIFFRVQPQSWSIHWQRQRVQASEQKTKAAE
jgi:hypothetical protein